MQIRKRRLEVAKRLKNIRIECIQLKDESVQLAAHEACVKRLMENHPDEEDMLQLNLVIMMKISDKLWHLLCHRGGEESLLLCEKKKFLVVLCF